MITVHTSSQDNSPVLDLEHQLSNGAMGSGNQCQSALECGGYVACVRTHQGQHSHHTEPIIITRPGISQVAMAIEPADQILHSFLWGVSLTQEEKSQLMFLDIFPATCAT